MEEPGNYKALLARDDPIGRSRWPEGLSRAGAWWLLWREKHTLVGMDYLMSEIFPPMGRLGQGDSKGGVASWK